MADAAQGSEPERALRAVPEDAPRRRRARAPRGAEATHSRPILATLGRAGLDLAARLSPRAAYRLGGFLGRAYSRWPTRSALATRVNLELCFPELSASERRGLYRASFAHTGRCLLELGRIWRGRDQRIPEIVRTVRGRELLEGALAQGKGVLMIVPHLGAWEFLGVFLGQSYPVTSLYRPPRVRQMDPVMRHGRERHGCRLVPADPRGVLALQRALERGEIACVLPDQDPGRGAGVFVPFFGHVANTGTLIARLAARSGAPVLVGCALRTHDGRFDVVFAEADPAIAGSDPIAGSAAVNRAVERCVRSSPEQYLWSYKRFRIQPPGSPNPYRRRSPEPEGGPGALLRRPSAPARRKGG
jgi:KDO2-lipid IV(A) lauroyltransferase